MGDVSILVTEIQATGFDVTAADALVLLDRRHKQMCEEASWWRELRDGTTTTAPQLNGVDFCYVIVPLDAVELFTVLVGAATTLGGAISMYTRTPKRDLPAILTGTLQLSGEGGVFCERAPSGHTDPVPLTLAVLYPPVVNNTPVQMEGAYIPPTLTTAETNGSFIRIPKSFYSRLLAGVYADLLSRPNEARSDLAAPQEALFNSAVGELRDRTARQYRTHGVRQIRL
jgi:hypothetical protein